MHIVFIDFYRPCIIAENFRSYLQFIHFKFKCKWSIPASQIQIKWYVEAMANAKSFQEKGQPRKFMKIFTDNKETGLH